MRLVRGLGGIVAAGTVALMLVVVGTALVAARRGFPGPGAESLGWHLVTAVVVVGAQIYSDRRRGVAVVAASVVVLAAAGLLLWTQWWS